MKSLKITLTLLFLLQILSSTALCSTLKAGIFDIPPWGYKTKNGEITGIEFDIIRAISEEMGEEIEIELVPYKRMLKRLAQGEIDFSIFFRSKESEKNAKPIVKWGDLDIIVVGMKGKKIQKYKDLKKMKIGVRLGGFFNKRFDSDESLNKFSTKDYSKGVELLKLGRIDAIIGTAATLFYEFKKYGIKVSELSKPYYIGRKADWLHFSLKSKRQEKKGKLVKVVNKLIKKGTFSKIFSKYLPKKWHHR